MTLTRFVFVGCLGLGAIAPVLGHAQRPTKPQAGKDSVKPPVFDVPVLPKVTGLTVQEAMDSLMRSAKVQGIKVGDSLVVGTATGIVVAQRPEAGRPAFHIDRVQLVTAREATIVPGLHGLTDAAARELLKRQQLQMRESVQPAERVTDTVSWQSRDSGTVVEIGSFVDVQFAAAPDWVIVPDVYGLPITTAADSARQLGFNIEITGTEKGFVLSQAPNAGERVIRGTLVRLVRGVRVPPLVGLSFDSTRRILEEAELLPQPRTAPLGASVRTQSPAPDSIVPPQSIVSVALDTVAMGVASTGSTPERGRSSDGGSSVSNSVLWLIGGLVILVGVGLAARSRIDNRKSAQPLPDVRAVAHKPIGTHQLLSSDELIRTPEFRFMFRGSSPHSSLLTNGSLTGIETTVNG